MGEHRQQQAQSDVPADVPTYEEVIGRFGAAVRVLAVRRFRQEAQPFFAESFGPVWEQLGATVKAIAEVFAPVVEAFAKHEDDCPMILAWQAWQRAKPCHCLCGTFHATGVCSGEVHPLWEAQVSMRVRVCEACRASAHGWLVAVIDEDAPNDGRQYYMDP